jgi:hypothetical protein
MRSLALLAVIGFVVAPALADWNPGDPYKMQFPQLPDPTGWDVNATSPIVLADDWLCTETGPVSDVHLWVSSEGYDGPPFIEGIQLSIHSNVAGPAFSYPGPMLWTLNLPVPSPNVVIRPYGQGPEGWYDPSTGQFNRPDHSVFYQINVTDIPDAFIQQVNTLYWLDVSFQTPAGLVPAGWKTSLDHFQDAAVWGTGTAGWQPMLDPETGAALDMAFVITPEPVSGLLLVVGGLMLSRRGR